MIYITKFVCLNSLMTVDNFFRHKLLVAHRSINRLGASAASDVEPILSPVQIDHTQLLIDGLIDLSPFCFVLKQLLFNSCEYKHMEQRLFVPILFVILFE